MIIKTDQFELEIAKGSDIYIGSKGAGPNPGLKGVNLTASICNPPNDVMRIYNYNLIEQ